MIRVEASSDITRVLPSDASLEATRPELTTKTDGAQSAVTFGDLLEKTVGDASASDHAAQAKVDALAAGTSDDLHGTMIAVKEAEISMKLVGTIRNKLLDAFQELWRTSV